MPDTPVQPAPVLNYDSLPQPRSAWKLLRRIIVFVICGVAGAYAGFWISPVRFVAAAYVQIPSGGGQQAAVTSMTSPAATSAAVASAKINAVTFTPAEASQRLKVRAVSGSQLIEVSAVHEAPEVAASLVAGVINWYVAANPSARFIGGPSILARQQLQPAIIVAGLVAGLIGAWIILRLRWR